MRMQVYACVWYVFAFAHVSTYVCASMCVYVCVCVCVCVRARVCVCRFQEIS